MSLRCLFGHHDWEVHEERLLSQVLDEVYTAYHAKPPAVPVRFVTRSICLRCSKKIDEVEMERRAAIEQLDTAYFRKRKASVLWGT